MNNLITNVKNDGIAIKENWLSPEDQKKIAKIITSINPRKGEKKSWLYVNFKISLIKLIKLQFVNLYRSLYFINLSKKLELNKIAEKILGNKVRLVGIDCYINLKSNKPVLDWHVDNAYTDTGDKNITKFVNPNQNAIKFFFYLTDVYKDNGCLSYVPKSHKIATALKKGIYEGSLSYNPYFTLSDFRKTISKKKNFSYIKNIIGEELVLEFLKKTEFIENTNTKNDCFNYEVNKGGAVIFDEAGVHRGSKTKFNDRIVLRFFFRRI